MRRAKERKRIYEKRERERQTERYTMIMLKEKKNERLNYLVRVNEIGNIWKRG